MLKTQKTTNMTRFKKQSVILSLKTPCIHVPYTCKAPLQAHRHPKPLPGAHPHAAWPWCWLGFLGDFDHFSGSHPSLGRSIERRLPNYRLMHRCNGSFLRIKKNGWCLTGCIENPVPSFSFLCPPGRDVRIVDLIWQRS